MKLGLIALVGAFQLFAISSFACVDLSGDYANPEPDIKGRTFVSKLRHNSCDTIAVGTYLIEKGQKTKETEERVRYVKKGLEDQCEIKSCRIIEETQDGITFAANSLMRVGDKVYCRYTKVDWALDTLGNLVQTYYFDDNSPKCTDIASFTRFLEKVQ